MSVNELSLINEKCNTLHALNVSQEHSVSKIEISTDKGLASHTACGLRKKMEKDRGRKLNRNIECTVCSKIISDRRNFNRHLRTIHGIQPQIRKARIKCSFSDNCTFVCATSSILRDHLESVHSFIVTKQEFHFQNRYEFEKWKEDEEIRTCASYVTDTGVKNRNKKKIYYLRCHRSGPIRAEQNVRKERLRSKPLRGYTRCGLTCPSSMQVIETQSGDIDVCYFPKHLGHKTDDDSVKFMKLRQKEKEEITAKLIKGEPIGKIIIEAQAQMKSGKNLSRVNFLQRRDVYNIKSKVKFLEKEIDQDGKRIDNWLKRLSHDSVNNNPIAYYKPIDESNDYMLVIMHHIQKITFSLLYDGSIVYVRTKKGKAHVDFNLTVVNVINENGCGYPLAFCLSSKCDYSTLLAFFQVIFDNCGLVTAQIFISDNITYYYLAWKNVMSECENRLVCNFNIHSYWNQKLTELRCPLKKHDALSDTLKQLLNEIDPDIFESELAQSLNKWNEDKDLKQFHKFFKKFYSRKPYEWANCYRIHSVRKENINQYLRPLYNNVEKIYAEGVNDIHIALNSIMLLIRSECYITLLKWDEDILIEKLKEVEKTHRDSQNFTDISFDDDEWIIRCSDLDFVVKKEKNNCKKDCGVICDACGICLHNFNCTCSDFLINFAICSHIHAVAMWTSSKQLHIKNIARGGFIASSALKLSAISLTKTMTRYLEKSDLTDLQYDKIILDLDKLIKEHSLKDRFEDACIRKFAWNESA